MGELTDHQAEVISWIFYFLAAISACVAIGGIVGQQHRNMTKGDDE
jgi:hypothetical protein